MDGTDEESRVNDLVDGFAVAQKVKESHETNFGYNAVTHEYGDLMKMGVIVPTTVERTALQNAPTLPEMCGSACLRLTNTRDSPLLLSTKWMSR